jgi:hypothetical protein
MTYKLMSRKASDEKELHIRRATALQALVTAVGYGVDLYVEAERLSEIHGLNEYDLISEFFWWTS